MRITFLILASFLLYFSGQSQTWQAATAPPNFLTDHSFGFSFDGIGYLVAGTEEFVGPTDKFMQYDPAADEWTILDPFPGPPRGFAIGDVWDRKAYFGFGTSPDSLLRDLWVFDADSMKWSELAPCPCAARTHPTLVANNGKIFVGLGSGNSGNMNDWWEYDIATNQWAQKTDFPDVRRHHPYQFAAVDYVYTGFGHGQGIFNDWYRYDPATDTWERMADLPDEGRVAGTQFSYKDKGYVLSGDGDDHLSMEEGEFWEYDPEINTWLQLPSHPGKSRWAPASFIIDGVVYLYNGTTYFEGSGSFYQAEAYKFDLEKFNSEIAKEFPLKLIRPMLFNDVQSVQLLPDSSIRIFSRSQKSAFHRFEELLMTNVELHGFNSNTSSIGSPQTVPFYSASKLFHLPLQDGSSILAAEMFDCDFDPKPVLGFIDGDGQLKWHFDFDQHDIHWMGLVDSNLIAVAVGVDTLYINFEGQLIDLSESPTVYSHSILVGDNLIGITTGEISILDASYNAIFTEPYTNSIYFANDLDSNTLFTASDEEICIWTDQLSEKFCRPTLDSIISVTTWNNEIWLAGENSLIQYNSSLNFMKKIEASAHEKFNFIVSTGDTLYTTSTYFGINHSDIVLRKFLENGVKFSNTKDIGVSNLIFPPQVEMVFLPNCPFGSGLHFDSLKVTVRNYSLDTLTSFEIHYDIAGGEGQCRSWQNTWQIDSIELLPLDSVVIELDSFNVECVHLNGRNFCLWVSTPNGETDVIPENDLFCDEIPLLIKTEDEIFTTEFLVFPNPAKDELYIKTEGLQLNASNWRITDALGRVITSGKFDDAREFEIISIVDVASGLYVFNAGQYSKLIVIQK